MSANRSGVQPSAKEESSFNRSLLEDDKTREKLRIFKQLILSCYGPRGKLKIIHNNVGGHSTLTSSSGRLLHCMSFTDPIIKFLVSATRPQISNFSDGGLHTTGLSLLLIEKALDSDFSHQAMIEFYEQLLDIITNKFDSDWNFLKMKGKLSNLVFLKGVVRSVLNSKPMCNLVGSKQHHISSLVLETFLKVINDTTNTSIFSKINFLTFEGVGVEDSKILPGFAVEIHERSNYRLLRKKLEDNKSGTFWRVVMCEISLSGDSDEIDNCCYELNESIGNPQDVIIDKMLHFSEQIVVNNVDIFLCQKVVHPQLKQYLRSKHVLVVERLGASNMTLIKQMISSSTVRSLSLPLTDKMIGTVNQVNVEQIYGKNFVHLSKDEASVITFVVCHNHEQEVEELKELIKSCLRCLEILLQDGSVFPGGGCWEAVMCDLVSRHDILDDLAKDLRCTANQLRKMMQCFTSSLITIVKSLGQSETEDYVDSSYHHLWSLPKGDDLSSNSVNVCNCGLIRKDEGLELDLLLSNSEQKYFDTCYDRSLTKMNELYDNAEVSSLNVSDSYSCRFNSLKTAVRTACAILSIHQTITDVN